MESPERVHHVGVVVRNMDEALRFFRDALGLALLKEEVVEDQGVRAALLAMGNPALSEVEGSLLELLEPTLPDTGIARYLEQRGEGLHHVCLEVPDIDAALADLKSKGVPLVDETPRPGLTGTIAFLHPSALHGVLVELVHGPTAFHTKLGTKLGATLDPRPSTLDPGGAGAGGVVSRLDHLVLAVQALQEAADAWARTFGLEAEPPYQPPGSHLQLARLPFADDDTGGAFLELAQPTRENHRVARFIADRGEGMFSLSLEVDDLDAAVRDLRAKGIPVSTRPALSEVEREPGAWPGTRLARIPRAAGHGVAVQLIERA